MTIDRGSEPSDGGPCENTDRHLWPDVSKYDAPHESIHVTKEGGIGINVGGTVYVKPLSEWHRLAGGPIGFRPKKTLAQQIRDQWHWPISESNDPSALHQQKLALAAADVIERLHKRLYEAREALERIASGDGIMLDKYEYRRIAKAALRTTDNGDPPR